VTSVEDGEKASGAATRWRSGGFRVFLDVQLRRGTFFRLTHSFLAIYQSIADGIWIKMSKAHDVLFRTLADPTRRAIFERLCREGEKTVGALTARAGVSQPVVSKHLGVLKEAGLVRGRHQGRETHYSAQLSALSPLIDWTGKMAGFWEGRFDDLEDLLKRMDQ
jgi:DNA-binding transcriptional ArsR family regulator